MLRHRFTLATGLGLTLVGCTITVMTWHNDTAQRFGLAAIMVGITLSLACSIIRSIGETNRPADHAYEIGYDMGYEKGYHEGRKAHRLTVVPIRSEQSTAHKR